ncbi:hypothetical protein N0V82_004203 [Gnomoniopsis sp. IMI 355080]|nr:hypothetical protein N0V82_004203 [Gnomoniopsis sp. IMI 355080]
MSFHKVQKGMDLQTPTNNTGRASKLAGWLRSVLRGTREIRSTNDAKLFFEAARTQSPPSSCIEGIVASKHGIEALQFSARRDLGTAFIKEHTLQFVEVLADEQLKLLADGQILQQALSAIVTPPTFWKALVKMVKASEFEGNHLKVFAWLCLELLSLPTLLDLDLAADIEDVTQNNLINTACPETRRLSYKIQHQLQLRKCPTSRAGESYCPGGRHDNDFEDFRKIAVYPTADEFLSTERPFYRRAKEVFETEMLERSAAHLDNIYRLTREDLLGELRSDWQNTQVRKRGQRSAITLGGLWPIGLELGDDKFRKKCSLAISVSAGFEELERKQPALRRKWLKDHNYYLRHQAFGALYRGQEIFGFAFIDRDIDQLVRSPPIIILRFADETAFTKALLALKTPHDLMFTLVDTPVYAYEPVLERLKNMGELPLQDILLNPLESVDDFVPKRSLQAVVERLSSTSDTATLRLRLGTDYKEFNLDHSQLQSLSNALGHKVSIIQGPPGTGKSFIGALAARFIVQKTDLRILVITYNNHALDQFLEDLLDLGIGEHEMVRLGSKSTARTSPFLLSALRSEYRRTKDAWTVIDLLKHDANEHSDELKKAFNNYLQSRPSFEDIQDHLEFSEDEGRFFEAFNVPSENAGFRTIGNRGKSVRPDYLYERWRTGRGPGVYAQQAFSQHESIWRIELSRRHQLVNKWFSAVLREKAERVQAMARRYDTAQNLIDVRFNENKVHTLRARRIIGSTTTGAAMYTKLLESAQPDIVIVEEAGEIQESHVLTALTASVKQLVLIGDHKQLRPKISNYNLTVEKGEGYDLNRSMFERLILQGHTHTTLQRQHRMHPDISVLVRELTYPDLEDDPKTELRVPICGLEDRVVFVNHSHAEEQYERLVDRRDPGAKASKENMFEAQMVLKIVKYLAQQGYKTHNLVVLTPYLGQLRLVRDMLMDEIDPLMNDLDSHELIQAGLLTRAAASVGKSPLRISTIDNYQGEEADIVIVSLTRSNSDGDIGFLAARERLNVLLSRARDCLIMLGNMETYMHSKKGGDTWLPFFESMKNKNHLYDGVPVRCERHPENRFLLRVPEDFDRCCPDGGCAESWRKDTCFECVREDMETERRIKRDLKLEAERMARQDAYQKELAEIKDGIEHQRRMIKYHQDDEDQKKTLLQQKADLASLKATADRISKAKPAPKMPDSVPPADPPTPLGANDSLEMIEGAKQEWEHLKQFEGAKSGPLDELMGMTGLEEVKLTFLGIKQRVDTALRQDISLQNERFSCSMLGNPGTGKTTVARLYAKFLTSIGVIPGTDFREQTGAGLANAGVNGCQKLIEDMLDNGGGVLFIDEAYQLASGNSYGGAAVLDYLLPEIENLSGKIVFVLAGYNKQMESFFAHNPGLPSRFPVDMKFDDYTDDELLSILELKIHQKYKGRMKCEDGTKGLYCRITTRRIGRSRGKDMFGNARTVENTLSTIAQRQAVRLTRERCGGKKPDDLLFTKEDLIGPEPTEALGKSKAWLDLQELIGLTSVKEAVKALVDSVGENYQREVNEQPPIEYTLNKVFLGNPGTGKTSIAKLYGRILVDLGMLTKGEVVIKNPSDFVGSVLGESERLSKGILASTVGKVLVIDEAYGLYGNAGSNADPYKTAVIDTIVAEVQGVPGDDRCVLLLGYKEEMETLFQNVNKGLSRRFPLSSAFEFHDFDDDELQRILELKLKQQAFNATDQAKDVVKELLKRARNRPNFGNAGEIDIILNEAKSRHQRRLSRKETSIVQTLDARDFDENFDRAERAATNVAMLFADTVGNEEVVSLLQGYQETVRAMKKLGVEPKEHIPFNFLFKGPPGTGKTTTARKMGKVFYDMGFLATAEVIECSATDLIGQYIGQTGPKVQHQLDKALGKVLFIDEAYRLGEGHFSKEAMDEIVDATTEEKYAKRMIIILAGYEEDINRLMHSNQGLTSRFPQQVNFRSLAPYECIKLFLQELSTQQKRLRAKKDLDLSALEDLADSSREKLAVLFEQLSQQDGWANARDVKEVSSATFRNAIKHVENGTVTITLESVEAELRRMLQDRTSCSQSVSMSLPTRFSPLKEPTPRLSSSRIDPGVSIATRQSTTLESSSTNTEEQEPPMQAPEAVEEANSVMRHGIRDAGVTDEVWSQLQRDREAEDQREQEYHDLLKAQRTVREEHRNKILKRLLEEEERRKKEAEVRKKLETHEWDDAGPSGDLVVLLGRYWVNVDETAASSLQSRKVEGLKDALADYDLD